MFTHSNPTSPVQEARGLTLRSWAGVDQAEAHVAWLGRAGLARMVRSWVWVMA